MWLAAFCTDVGSWRLVQYLDCVGMAWVCVLWQNKETEKEKWERQKDDKQSKQSTGWPFSLAPAVCVYPRSHSTSRRHPEWMPRLESGQGTEHSTTYTSHTLHFLQRFTLGHQGKSSGHTNIKIPSDASANSFSVPWPHFHVSSASYLGQETMWQITLWTFIEGNDNSADKTRSWIAYLISLMGLVFTKLWQRIIFRCVVLKTWVCPKIVFPYKYSQRIVQWNLSILDTLGPTICPL